MTQCMGRRGERGRTGVFDGLTLLIQDTRYINKPKSDLSRNYIIHKVGRRKRKGISIPFIG